MMKTLGLHIPSPKINMEAGKGPYMEDSSLIRGPFSTSMLIWRSVESFQDVVSIQGAFESRIYIWESVVLHGVSRESQ